MDLNERLRTYAKADDLHPDERATLLEAATEIEALRAEREVIGAEAVKYAEKSGRLEAKVYLLAEALQIAYRHLDTDSMQVSHKTDLAAIRAALRDHDQEVGQHG